MKVNEIFKSIQGESTWQGLPCVFVRLTGCNLRCSYCDTKYAYNEGHEISIGKVVDEVKKYNCSFIEITGGEPLLQEETHKLSNELLNMGYTLLVDTNGSISIESLDSRVIKIMDIKCPGSGMSEQIFWNNLNNLTSKDEVKFVVSDYKDYQWSKNIIKQYSLVDKVNILLSTVFGKLSPKSLAEWILKDNLKVRLQLQLHKYIWADEFSHSFSFRGH